MKLLEKYPSHLLFRENASGDSIKKGELFIFVGVPPEEMNGCGYAIYLSKHSDKKFKIHLDTINAWNHRNTIIFW